MKKIIIVICCIAFEYTAFSQSEMSHQFNQLSYDSLWREKALHTTRDSTLVDIWTALSNRYKFNRYDSGLYYAGKALKLSREIGYGEGELLSLHHLSLSYGTMGNVSRGLRTSLEGMRRAEELGSKRFQGTFSMNLGNRHYSVNENEVSLRYFRRANELFNSIKNENFSAISAGFIGKAHAALNNTDSAFYYCYLANKLADLTQVNWVISSTNNVMGDLYQDLHNSDSAIHYFRKGFSHSNGEVIGRPLKIAKILNARGQTDSCMYYAEIALQYALDNNLYSSIAETNLFLSGLYETRDPAKALQYNKVALAYKDSLIYLNQQSGFSELIDLEELQRQREFEATQKAYRNKIRLYLLLGGLAVLLLIIFLLYRNNRNKQKARKKIEEAYHQLQSTQSQLIQSEKMASLGELTAGIAHEIQNPLNFVNNFSEVNEELLIEMKDELDKGNVTDAKSIASSAIENQQKILHHGKRADAIVKGMLQHSKGSSGQKEPTDINALCDEYLRLAYHGLRAKDKSFNAKFETNFDSSLPKINVVRQDIGRVILNLITNAFYAVNVKTQDLASPPYEPTVSVSTKKDEGKILISVKDNGNGIPEHIKEKIFQPFFTTKPTGQGTGLGLSLSYDIVKAHGGELKVETKKNEGCTFLIKLPLAEN